MQLKLDLEKKDYISKFLKNKIPVPRSYRMIDRLELNKVTVGKGKLFGPEDYFSVSFLAFFLITFFIMRKRNTETYTFENLENVNIYNALKPSEVVQLYEDNFISPQDQEVLNSVEHQVYKQKMLMNNVNKKMQSSLSFGLINDVPKVDLKKQFKESINKNSNIS